MFSMRYICLWVVAGFAMTVSCGEIKGKTDGSVVVGSREFGFGPEYMDKEMHHFRESERRAFEHMDSSSREVFSRVESSMDSTLDAGTFTEKEDARDASEPRDREVDEQSAPESVGMEVAKPENAFSPEILTAVSFLQKKDAQLCRIFFRLCCKGQSLGRQLSLLYGRDEQECLYNYGRVVRNEGLKVDRKKSAERVLKDPDKVFEPQLAKHCLRALASLKTCGGFKTLPKICDRVFGGKKSVGQSCQTTEECTGWARCEQQRCTRVARRVGESCEDIEPQNAPCDDGYLFCSRGVCLARKEKGQVCGLGTECKSNQCVRGNCSAIRTMKEDLCPDPLP